MVESNDEHLVAVLKELHWFKVKNRELLRQNTDLTIENAKLKIRLEMLEAFNEREGTEHDNQH